MAAITGHLPSLRRQIKNVACNYSDAQVKVREATSNDPWGASTTLMSEIADMTYNAMAFTEIMQMLWKRLNDSGKNWRHVYKSLVLLDYLIKVGSEKVAHQCRENIFAIQTLKDFQHIEDNKDQGMNVREKAKQLVAILKDDELMKNERAKALMARKRFIQNGSGLSSDGTVGHKRMDTCRSDNDLPAFATNSDRNSLSTKSSHKAKNSAVTKSTSDISSGGARIRRDSELDECRPTSAGEEELQLQIALALSKEEAEREQDLRKNDDVRLQLALQESEKVVKHVGGGTGHPVGAAEQSTSASAKNTSALDDLLSLQTSPPVHAFNHHSAANFAAAPDPWGQSSSGTTSANNNIVFNATTGTAPLLFKAGGPVKTDPWGCPTVIPSSVPNADAFSEDPWASSVEHNSSAGVVGTTQSLSSDPWGSDVLAPSVVGRQPTENGHINNNNIGGVPAAQQHQNENINTTMMNGRKLKTPDTFLGENSALVNLDNLMSASTATRSTTFGTQSRVQNGTPTTTNPFSATPSTNTASNPFSAQQKRATPTLNEIRTLTNQQTAGGAVSWSTSQQQSFGNSSTTTISTTTNPFL